MISSILRTIVTCAACYGVWFPSSSTFAQDTTKEQPAANNFDTAVKEYFEQTVPAPRRTPGALPTADPRVRGPARVDQSLIAPPHAQPDREAAEQFPLLIQQLMAQQAQLKKELADVQNQLQASRQQLAKPTPLPDDASIKVFLLLHASPEQVADGIRRMIGDETLRVAVDKNQNAVLVGANEKKMQEIARLVQLLDQPATNTEAAAAETNLKAFTLVNIDPLTAAAALQPIFSAERPQFSIVEGTKTLLVRGKRDSVMEIEAILLGIDRAPNNPEAGANAETLQVQLIWISGNLPAGVGIDLSERRDLIPAVAESLGKLGLSEPRILCDHMASVVRMGRQEGTFSFRLPVTAGTNRMEFSGEGQIARIDGSPLYKLELSTKDTTPNQPVAPAAERMSTPAVRHVWSMNGTVAMPTDHYVVMGTTNVVLGQSGGSYPTALVIHLDRLNNPAPPAVSPSRGFDREYRDRGRRGRRGGPAENQPAESLPAEPGK